MSDHIPPLTVQELEDFIRRLRATVEKASAADYILRALGRSAPAELTGHAATPAPAPAPATASKTPPRSLRERNDRVLAAMRSTSTRVTTRDLMADTGIDAKSVQLAIRGLRRAGIVDVQGSGAGARYFLAGGAAAEAHHPAPHAAPTKAGAAKTSGRKGKRGPRPRPPTPRPSSRRCATVRSTSASCPPRSTPPPRACATAWTCCAARAWSARPATAAAPATTW
jgi:hypothetical protein